MAGRNLDTNSINQNGTRDNGSENGITSVEVLAGRRVIMPFKDGTDIYTGGGTVTPSLISTANYNPTGTGTVLSASITNSGTSYACIDMHITGRFFGLLFYNSAMSGLPVGCMIDGVAYEIDTTYTANDRLGSGDGGSLDQNYAYKIIADDLDDGDHFVELLFPAHTGSGTRAYRLNGYVVDANAGYVAPERGCIPATVEAIPVTSGSWPSASGASNSLGSAGSDRLFSILGYNLYNSTAAAIEVKCMINSAALGNTIFAKSIPAYTSEQFLMPAPMYQLDSKLYWVASATGVNISGIQGL